MSNAPSRLKELYERYLSGHCSEAEQKEFFALLSAHESGPALHGLIDASFDEESIPFQLPEDRAGALFDVIRKRTIASEEVMEDEIDTVPGGGAKLRGMVSKRWWVAASILLICIAGIRIVQRPSSGVEDRQTVQQFEPVMAEEDHSGAVLTLADGTKLLLDSMKIGSIAIQNGTHVTLNEQGLVYDNQNTDEPASYNTMSTPRGRQFRLHLPDGTEVVLNAGSSIRYPVHFNGKERVVFVEGEAWLDVKEDATKPFRVETPRQASIEVLGTAFNIRCYPEEPIAKTTLLSGKIRYTAHDQRKILAPGQQLQQNQHGALYLIAAMDTSQVMAWKNGEFSFQHQGLEEAIREIARWYNLEPVYTGEVPVFEFYGSIGRNLKAEQVVRLLNNMGLHISLEQNKLIISP
ncbi:MAG: FecR domain-containing protein [Chitinophagaceae bacterium]|nr:FecR domain-containing protein [Chitinophagaceae bacterium]